MQKRREYEFGFITKSKASSFIYLPILFCGFLLILGFFCADKQCQLGIG